MFTALLDWFIKRLNGRSPLNIKGNFDELYRQTDFLYRQFNDAIPKVKVINEEHAMLMEFIAECNRYLLNLETRLAALEPKKET